ncbi:hypothetical protein V6N13_126830 [Hibiscus sabdariffa]
MREDAVKGFLDFQFETIPDGLPPSDSNATQSISALCDSYKEIILRGIVPFKDEQYVSDGTLEMPIDIPVLQALADKSTNIYAIDPLASLSRRINMPEIQHDRLNLSLWKEETSYTEWLNTKEPNSVVYVNYGSITVMSNHHLKEFAWELANGKYPFLWIVRPEVVTGESAVLPKELMEETKERGFITSWCL